MKLAVILGVDADIIECPKTLKKTWRNIEKIF
jgi:hypothetical protein